MKGILGGPPQTLQGSAGTGLVAGDVQLLGLADLFHHDIGHGSSSGQRSRDAQNRTSSNPGQSFAPQPGRGSSIADDMHAEPR
ncbi:hypothetical protein GCM10010168_12080 [Actinoplanes ianthinogenes]|nr:hypothetical protein GCM10010168_12080 [Actinoplanes ianthinogenes]